MRRNRVVMTWMKVFWLGVDVNFVFVCGMVSDVFDVRWMFMNMVSEVYVNYFDFLEWVGSS